MFWGGGSEGSAFLTTLGERGSRQPRTHTTCIAGAGQVIVTPNFLLEDWPDVVTAMSPIYGEEIASELAAMDLPPSS